MKFFCLLLIGSLLSFTPKGKEITIYCDVSVPQFNFAAADIQKALEDRDFQVVLMPIAKFTKKHAKNSIIIAQKTNQRVLKILSNKGGDATKITDLEAQAFALRTTSSQGQTHWVIGGDVAGTMYGGLELAEKITFHGLDITCNEEQKPYIKKRGIKFNIPLDERIPSLDSDGDQDKSNIKDMWDMDFWKAYFDNLARNRYNAISYWNRHQFPAMIQLKDYPDVALDDVYDGYGTLVKKMTIQEKIAFWQEVMEYAHNRSMDIYYIYTNLYMTGVNGKYGITEDCYNDVTNDYLRKSVSKFLRTYPYVNGIGVTAGEHKMKKMSFEEREKWLWSTYVEGILDAKKENPDREIRLIHRHWFSSVVDIVNHFKDYKDPFEFSFKYARAHMYSSPNIEFEDFLLDEMPEGVRSWWNLRNDDLFYLRWGDPEYTRDFILNFDKQKTAGYLMGSDGYTWGRVYSSTDPAFNGQLENRKHWYNFMLWGRLGYNPNIPASVFKNSLRSHFPELLDDNLYEAWKTASKIAPQTTRFFWRNWDYHWYVEGSKGTAFITVNDFINGKTMDGSGILNIMKYAKKMIAKQEIKKITPLQVADNLSALADESMRLVKEVNPKGNKELLQTKNDIIAFAHLGNYYSEKIKGATDLALFTLTTDKQLQKSAVSHLQRALKHWKLYAATLSLQYTPREYSRSGMMDWNALTIAVENDIALAKNPDLYQLDISFPDIAQNATFPKGDNVSIAVKVASTFDIVKVTSKINGEDLVDDMEAPYEWNEQQTPLLGNMVPGVYEFVTIATDIMGHQKEKTLKIIIK